MEYKTEFCVHIAVVPVIIQ